MRRVLFALFAIAVAGCDYGVTDGLTSPTSSTTSTSTSTSTTATTTGSTGTGSTTPAAPTTPTTGLTYTKDIAPIMTADCVVCHGPTRRDAGYDFSSYAGVMKAVSSTTANAKLVRVTRAGGLMYSQFRSNASTKSQTIYDWVVTYKAAQQ